MAKITQFPEGIVIYNVDHSVGKFGRNHKSDVQLVQVLLNALINNIKMAGNGISKDPVPDILAVYGICGPTTIEAILWFQKASPSLAKDATMNSVDDAGYYGASAPARRKAYTLRMLNSELLIRSAMPSKSAIVNEPLASELRKFSKEPTL